MSRAERQESPPIYNGVTTNIRERVGNERFFWPNVIDILQTNDTDALRQRTRQIAAAAPHVNETQIGRIMTTIGQAYAKNTRQYTGNNEENHSLQVFLVAAEILGLQRLTTLHGQIALGHNLIEDTTMPPAFREGISSVEAYAGIRALSHKEAGIPLYPNRHDKAPHFRDIVQAHSETPEAELLAIKVADQIVVGNDPLTAHELEHQGHYERWARKSTTKVNEMELLLDMIPEEELRIRHILSQAINFTSIRLDPEVGPLFSDAVYSRRAPKNNV